MICDWYDRKWCLISFFQDFIFLKQLPNIYYLKFISQMGCGSSKKDDIIVPSKGDKKATTSEVMSNSTNKP